MTLSLQADRSLIRAQASSARYLLATVRAPEAPARRERLPVNVALVLDRSGSMGGERKFPLARRAVQEALAMLRAEDRFTLVVYDTMVDVLARAVPATPAEKRRALDLLAGIEPRGGTDLCEGWLRGCEQLADHLGDDSISRALLLTDGLANAGITDAGEIARHAGELRRRGIATSTFGVGDDFDERLLRDMAREGGGNFWFIETPAQIADLLTSELGEALEVTMRRAVLTLELPRGAEAETLHAFRSRFAAGDRELRVELGDLASGQEVMCLVRVQFPRGAEGERATVRATVGGDDLLTPAEEATIEWTYASHAANDRQPRDVAVDREVARVYAARARAEATEANRRGDFDRARRVLERTARRIEEYAGTDRVLRATAHELAGEVPRFATEAMSPRELKMAMYAAAAPLMDRAPDGKARRPGR